MSAFRATLGNETLLAVSCVKDTPVKFAEYQVTAGEEIGLGYSNGGMDNALGRIYLDLQTAADADIDGLVRIQIASPQDLPLATVFEIRTEEIRSGASDFSKRIPFNASELNSVVTEDKKIQLILIADATALVDLDKSELKMSCSRNHI